MHFLHIVLTYLLLGLLPVAASAQTAPELEPSAAPVAQQPDYAAWNTRADAIEAELERPDVTVERLEALRAELVAFRAQFQEGRNVNEPRIESLRAQIDALGPAPEDPSSEAADISERARGTCGGTGHRASPARGCARGVQPGRRACPAC